MSRKSKYDYAHLNTYIDLSYIDSYDAQFIYIDSGRGPGKTTATYDRAVRRFLRYGETFVIIRRYRNEADGLASSPHPMTTYIENKYSDHNFSINKSTRTIYIDKEPAGFILYLNGTGPSQIKSISFGATRTVIFDEFQPELGGNYIANEFSVFKNLMLTLIRGVKTIDKNGSDTTRKLPSGRINFKVFCLSNSASYHNPYYDGMHLYPKIDGGVTYSKKAGVVIWHIINSDKADYSAIANLGSNDQFSQYMTSGSYLDMNNDSDIWRIKPSQDVRSLGRIEIAGRIFGVSEVVNQNRAIIYTRKGVGKLYSTASSGGIADVSQAPFWDEIQKQKMRGRIYFDSTATRSVIKTASPYLTNMER